MKRKERKHLNFRCIGPNVDEEKILALQKELEGNDFLKVARLLKIICGSSRFKILYLLSKEKELCVCDLADILQTTVSSVSHQLKVLKEFGILKQRREAKTVFYSLKPEWKYKLEKLFYEGV